MAHKGGDIFDIPLLGPYLGEHIQSQKDQRRFSSIPQFHPGGQQSLQFQPLEGLCPEMPPIDRIGVKAAVHQVGGDTVGGGGGIAVNKAAAVCGNGHI